MTSWQSGLAASVARAMQQNGIERDTCPCCGSVGVQQRARNQSNCVRDCHNVPADPLNGGRCVRDSCGWGCDRSQEPENYCAGMCRGVSGSWNGERRRSICESNCLDFECR